MGSCLSSHVKSASPLHAGASSRYVSSEGGVLSSWRLSQTTSVLLTAQGENDKSESLKSFDFDDLRIATGSFRPVNVLGEDGFGNVYKGWIDEHSFNAAKPGTGMVIAVKRLNTSGFHGHNEWLAQINDLGQLNYPNLVKLVGYCLEDEYRFLIYEFMPRGSLENHLFRRSSDIQPLSWSIRMKVALGAAKGLAYLHSAEVKVIYPDFKASNILLDSSYNAKLSDFGLAKDGPMDNEFHVANMGTYGSVAPEYLARGHLTVKSNVYSFGVILLEMITGCKVIDKNRPQAEHNLIEWARPYVTSKKRGVVTIIDPLIEGRYTMRGALRAATPAVKCLAAKPENRPSMNEVIKELEQLQDLRDSESGKSGALHQKKQRNFGG